MKLTHTLYLDRGDVLAALRKWLQEQGIEGAERAVMIGPDTVEMTITDVLLPKPPVPSAPPKPVSPEFMAAFAEAGRSQCAHEVPRHQILEANELVKSGASSWVLVEGDKEHGRPYTRVWCDPSLPVADQTMWSVLPPLTDDECKVLEALMKGGGKAYSITSGDFYPSRLVAVGLLKVAWTGVWAVTWARD